MEQIVKEFGYPGFDLNGEMFCCTYEGEFAHLMMDVRVYRMKAGQVRTFEKPMEEMAILLFNGDVNMKWEGNDQKCTRESVFTEGPWCLHVSKGVKVEVAANADCEFLVQCAINDKDFASKMYGPTDEEFIPFAKGKYGNLANRKVGTIVDKDINPDSNMVIGEIINDRGNWSGILPHKHPQPEMYFFMFDRPDTGFGASFVGDHIYKIVDHSFSAIPGENLHPQAVCPGYKMYFVWMIRHNEGDPWLQSTRNTAPEYLFWNDVDFDKLGD